MRAIQGLRNGLRVPTEEEARGLEDLYDAEVRAADEEVGRLLRTLDESGLGNDTIVVLWADHGENMYQHADIPGDTRGFRNIFGHGYQLYDSLVRVPLIVRWPGRLPAGLRVTRPVGTVQIKDWLLTLLATRVGERPVVEFGDERPL